MSRCPGSVPYISDTDFFKNMYYQAINNKNYDHIGYYDVIKLMDHEIKNKQAHQLWYLLTNNYNKYVECTKHIQNQEEEGFPNT